LEFEDFFSLFGRRLYDERIRPLMWSRAMNWALSRQLTMPLLGVPYLQRRAVQAPRDGGLPPCQDVFR
jgi:S-adenosylmethionine-diacylglycerol 3-amino-3-carboxypropyl transferase